MTHGVNVSPARTGRLKLCGAALSIAPTNASGGTHVACVARRAPVNDSAQTTLEGWVRRWVVRQCKLNSLKTRHYLVCFVKCSPMQLLAISSTSSSALFLSRVLEKPMTSTCILHVVTASSNATSAARASAGEGSAQREAHRLWCLCSSTPLQTR